MAQQVRDIMTQALRTVPSSATLDEAARTMRDADIGDVLVTKEDGALRGIITDRDITIRAVAEGRDPSTITVDDICSDLVVTIHPDTDTEEAATIMREHAIRRLPVTEGGKPVGIVSLGDLAIERDPRSGLADISAASGNE